MVNQDGKKARRKSTVSNANGKPNILTISPIKATRIRSASLSKPASTTENSAKTPLGDSQVADPIVPKNVPPTPPPPPPMVFVIDKVSKAPVPPPPPPPPTATLTSPNDESHSSIHTATPQGAIFSVVMKDIASSSLKPLAHREPEKKQDVHGFLSDIRSKQFVLKATSPISREEVKKANEPDGVAAILMRRAALEESDSGEGISMLIR